MTAGRRLWADMAESATLPELPGIDGVAREETRRRWATLTKPEGSLGRLEALGERISAIRGEVRPRFHRKTIVVFVADHGIAREGVSAYPASVTASMLDNFLAGGAAISVLARVVGAEVLFVDVGVDAEPRPERNGFRVRRVARGTRDFAIEPSMSREQAHQAVQVGLEIAGSTVGAGTDLLAAGDMGIGNTTSASALLASLTGRKASDVVGPGTGLDTDGVVRKARIIDAALRARAVDGADPWAVMAGFGGFEIAAMAGAALGAASRRVPVVVDGFIATVAALWASRLRPGLEDYLIPSHLSAEPAHRLALDELGLAPYLALGMRLGEGTGAALQMVLCDAATRLLDEMATFEEARVAGRVARE